MTVYDDVPDTEDNIEGVILSLIEESKKETTVPDGFLALPVGGFPVKINRGNVPDFAIAKIEARFPPPPIPVQFIGEKGRKEPNPSDPDYLKKLQEVSMQKVVAVTNTIVTFAVELGAEIPQDAVEQLVLLGYLRDDERDNKAKVEYFFKTEYLFNNGPNIGFLMSKMQVTEEAIEEAKRKFRG